ncbi:PREDICTED: peroxisome biogenesis factor 2-like [Priapulus caudatus]|uniref:Peroxisome biogenesis factor 2 n=1 Tax=Priapulus caudatus TaxID=37621 RepID=A0ABM1E3R1_PRICU|nr:PREDICTED: peroxisome biogenesis factor 2-like [Priapulus caudatus]
MTTPPPGMSDAGEAAPAGGALKVLRVSQLDASQLDGDLLELLREQCALALKYCHHPGAVASLRPELDALLRLLVWRFSLYAHGATVGQDLLDVRYVDARSGAPIARMQMFAYAAVVVGCGYLGDRLDDLLRMLPASVPRGTVARFARRAEAAARAAALLNFFMFLRHGDYQLLLERALGLQAQFRRPQEARTPSFKFTNREILWNGFSEFLLFLLPFVNFRRLRNSFRRMLARNTAPPGSARVIPTELGQCAVCELPPCVPHGIGCRHVFCYYCIVGNVMADASFACPRCGVRVEGRESVNPVILWER